MRVWIDQDCCTGAGLCVDRCPDLFIVLEDGIGYVRDGDAVVTDPPRSSVVVPARHEREAIDAAERCPGECIYLDTVDLSQPADHAADIQDAEIRDAHIQDVHIRDADIRDAHIRDADIRDAHIRDAHIQDAHTQDSRIAVGLPIGE